MVAAKGIQISFCDFLLENNREKRNESLEVTKKGARIQRLNLARKVATSPRTDPDSKVCEDAKLLRETSAAIL